MKRYRFAGRIALVSGLVCGLLLASCKEDDEDATGLLLLLALAGQTTTSPIYAGFADIPSSVTTNASNTSSTSTSAMTHGLDVAGNTELEGITGVFNPVRSSIKTNREIVYTIGELVKALKQFDPGSQVVQDTTTWSGQPAKIRYQSDTTFGSGGRKLEVWWNNAAAPYNSLKAIEIVFRDPNSGNTSTQDINGYVWGRFLPTPTSTSLGLLFVDFDYTAASGLKTMSVIIQGTGITATSDNAHFYVRVSGGITSIDGTITAKSFTEGINNSTSSRAYVFAAAGSDTLGRAVVKAALPLSSSTATDDTIVYGSGQHGTFTEVYTDWMLFNTTIFNSLKGTGASGCTTLTQPSSANPTTASGSTGTQLGSCFDAYRASNPGALSNIYYVSKIDNPGYYTYGNGAASLRAVGTAPSGDSSYGTVSAALLSGIRTTSSSNYAADFTPNAVANLDIKAGTNVPTAARWTTDDTAPF